MKRIQAVIILALFVMPATAAHAEQAYEYSGELFFCLPTCDVFPALGAATGGASNTVNSTVVGTFELAINPDNTFEVGTPLADPLPPVGELCNLATDPNAPPFSFSFINSGETVTFDNTNAVLAASGTVDSAGQIDSGVFDIAPTFPPFCTNNAVFTIDGAPGNLVGEILNSILFVAGTGTLASPDTDADGVPDSADNCTLLANPNQRDADGDGYGNRCDADFNNDCNVGFADLGLFRIAFLTDDPETDLNGDGTVNFSDLGLVRSLFFEPPGPSGVTSVCEQ